jgi:hypothetical protein
MERPEQNGKRKTDEYGERRDKRRENDHQKRQGKRHDEQKDGHGDKNVHDSKMIPGFHIGTLDKKRQ